MIGLDTNILIRYAAQDDDRNGPLANAVMDSLTVEDPGWIPLVAIAEFAWVMDRRYRVDRSDVFSILNQFFARPEIVLENAEVVQKAAYQFLHGRAEFSDYLVACSSQAAGCTSTLTFDRKASKSAGMTLVQ
jgi:predicted nucleic-acid-binding protein